MPTFRGFLPHEEISYTITEEPLVLTGTTATNQAVQDFIADVTTPSSSDNNCRLSFGVTQYTADNQTPSVCSLDTAGKITRLADGTCNIDLSIPGSKRRFSRTLSRSAGSASYLQKSFATGSLARHITDNIDAYLSGKSPGASQYTFTGESYSATAPAGTRNTGIFSGALDLSAFSFTISGRGSQFPVHLISDRHFICAAHVLPGVGATIVWLANDNTFKTATISSTKQITSADDLAIGYLSAPITGITPVSVLPANWQTKLPAIPVANYGQITVPVLLDLWDDATNRRKLVVGKNTRRPVGYPTTLIDTAPDGYTSPSAYASWSALLRGGDSGSPCFVPINDGALKTVLVGCMWQATAAGNIANAITEIESAMTSLAGSSYTLRQVNLAGFTGY